jgi:hypothetical protein
MDHFLDGGARLDSSRGKAPPRVCRRYQSHDGYLPFGWDSAEVLFPRTHQLCSDPDSSRLNSDGLELKHLVRFSTL